MFSVAGDEEIVDVVADTPGGAVGVPVEVGAMQRARAHRELTAGEQGPWLRLLLHVDRGGMVQAGFDYGDTMIPWEHLLSGEAYLVDLERYPRADVALWLMAHIAYEGQQVRTAAQAAEAQAGNGVGGRAAPRLADDEIPPLPELWSRMAALAAVCGGSDAPLGPRINPTYCVYRGGRGGCTLARLPDGRAVLSGGADDSVLLTAAYWGVIDFPELYRGAPRWVHNWYLDERVADGLLSFCYWWDGDHWYRADIRETPEQWEPVDEIVDAMPDLDTADHAARLVADMVSIAGTTATDETLTAAREFIAAAEALVATPRCLNRLFPDGVPAGFDFAEALAQLDAAGVLLPAHARIGAEVAKQLVADYCRVNRVETADDSLDRLEATRMDAGWHVYFPAAEGEIAIERPAFLVADDGVVQTATSGPTAEAAFAFTTRFAARTRAKAISAPG
ncbi:hypothetical protein A5624_10175 [Mycobacterium sp. 1482292.6]|nr:hypothetical protein A5624_10175 [Mycobacterium sp. 1482292.6]OBJ19704.1 hypothetical protein A5622_20350 [Mycobacterium sp. 1245801.1]